MTRGTATSDRDGHAGLRLTVSLAATLLLLASVPPAEATSATGTSSIQAANCALNIRAKPTTRSTRRAVIPAGTIVVVPTEVTGSAYATRCGARVSGSRWYAITAIGGRTVSSLFGVPVVYAASGLFRTAPILDGVDVSQWQGRIDFAKVRASGKRFVIARATEGRLYTDPAYARNRAGALAAGLAFTAYHWAHPDPTPGDAIKEADHFIAVAKLSHGMLAPVLDIESGASLGTKALAEWVATWLSRVYTRLGVRATIYTTPSFWRSALGDTHWFADHGYAVLWIAHWDVASPAVPAGDWGGRAWTFWQSSDCGTVPGISGCVDLDHFVGADLRAVTY